MPRDVNSTLNHPSRCTNVENYVQNHVDTGRVFLGTLSLEMGATAALDLRCSVQPLLTTTWGMLFRADCLDVFRELKSDSIDCIFADPPFNLGKDYGSGKEADQLARREYIEWSREWLLESCRVLKPGGSLFVYILPSWGFRFATFLEDEGLEFRHWIAMSMKGTFPRGRKLYPAHYALLYFTKGEPRIFNRVRLPVPKCRHCGKDIKDYGGHRKYLNPEGLNVTDFWDDTSPSRHRKYKTREKINELKPMISRRCFEIATGPGDVVMDPFGGGGSSYESAEDLERFWLGTEKVTTEAIVTRMRDRFPWSIDGPLSSDFPAVFVS